MSLAGAGGGGFLVLVTRAPGRAAAVAALLGGFPEATVHAAAVDPGPVEPVVGPAAAD
jgi:hypothetical protein